MPQSNPASIQRVALAGLGAIGLTVARALDGGGIKGYELAAVAVRDTEKAKKNLSAFQQQPFITDSFGSLADHADLVVECAPAKLLPEIIRPFLDTGKTAVVLSCGALLEHDDLIQLARDKGGRIMVPTGALIGLDAVTAAAEGKIHSVQITTRKPPRALLGAPYLVENNIDVENLQEPLRVFSGTPREAAKGFPANLNVSVAISLAGIGPDRTTLEIWADPKHGRNSHSVKVEADSARFSMEIENVPTEANPRTGQITAYSVISCLRKLTAPLVVGS